MAKKLRAIPLPDLRGKTVLDVGCDHAWWCWEAVRRGAKSTLGLERNRKVFGNQKDLIALNTAEAGSRPCSFAHVNLGTQWLDFGKHDVVFCFSMYHHFYENCGDHSAVWYWLWLHTKGELLWENPVGTDDPVVRLNVSAPYRREDILAAAERYFHVEYVGPALHVKTREVWRCIPKNVETFESNAKAKDGSGGAAPAFTYADNRRIREIQEILGFKAFPGSLNCKAEFDWTHGFFRGRIVDVVTRSAGLDGEWYPRWARFYPCAIRGEDDLVAEGYAFRFEHEAYKENFVELIADCRLRDYVTDEFTIVRFAPER